MGIVRKLKDAARWVENVVEEEATRRADDEPKPEPERPQKAELAVVAPTPLSGGCALRLLQAASFGGVVVATLAAALVGRWRR